MNCNIYNRIFPSQGGKEVISTFRLNCCVNYFIIENKFENIDNWFIYFVQDENANVRKKREYKKTKNTNLRRHRRSNNPWCRWRHLHSRCRASSARDALHHLLALMMMRVFYRWVVCSAFIAKMIVINLIFFLFCLYIEAQDILSRFSVEEFIDKYCVSFLLIINLMYKITIDVYFQI